MGRCGQEYSQFLLLGRSFTTLQRRCQSSSCRFISIASKFLQKVDEKRKAMPRSSWSSQSKALDAFLSRVYITYGTVYFYMRPVRSEPTQRTDNVHKAPINQSFTITHHHDGFFEWILILYYLLLSTIFLTFILSTTTTTTTFRLLPRKRRGQRLPSSELRIAPFFTLVTRICSLSP